MTRQLPLLLLPLVLLGCGGKDDGSNDSTPEDTGPTTHPLLPEGYEYRWDIDGCGDSNSGTANYVLGEATTDADGNITITERSYYFYGREWSEDCMDVLTYTGTAMSGAQINDFNASEAEEGYNIIRSITENNCSLSYEEDREYWYIFDTLTPSGNLNYENAMLVFRYYEGRRGMVSDTNFARGVFNPESTDTLGPPATYTWEGEDCDD